MERFKLINTHWKVEVPKMSFELQNENRIFMKVEASFIIECAETPLLEEERLVAFKFFRPYVNLLGRNIALESKRFMHSLWRLSQFRWLIPWIEDENVPFETSVYWYLWEFCDLYMENPYKDFYSKYKGKREPYPSYPIDALCMSYSDMYRDEKALETAIKKINENDKRTKHQDCPFLMVKNVY